MFSPPLVRNVWTRGGVDARVKAVKYMWALFACNDLLFRRFGVGRSGDGGVCHGRRETAWHVRGTCDDEQAARVRVRWAERMWSEVQKEVMRPKQALDIGVALAVKRLWSVEGKGDYLRSWAVLGSAEAVAGHGLDGHATTSVRSIATSKPITSSTAAASSSACPSSKPHLLWLINLQQPPLTGAS